MPTTTPSQFRLQAETIADLDLIAVELTRERGIRHTRTDAIRHAAHEAAKKIQKKRGKSIDTVATDAKI